MNRVTLLLTLVVLLICSQQPAKAEIMIANSGFDLGNAGQYNHWWSPWNWYTFTVIPDEATGQPVYHFRDWAVGPVELPIINGFPSWTYIPNFRWNPAMGGYYGAAEYGMLPCVDYSDGYDKPRKTGHQWMKKNAGNPYYSGVAQLVGHLVPGKVYEVSAWGVSSCVGNPPDMRILVDPNGGNDARTAPISSQPVPNRPLGRYWMWSSTGNHRIGNWLEFDSSNHAPDVIGGYQIWDKVSVQFTAEQSAAMIFLLTDSTTWVPGDGPGSGLGIGWDNVEVREYAPTATTVGAANASPDGTPVEINGGRVTAVFPQGNFVLPAEDPACFYVEDKDRAAGILVYGTQAVNRGDTINFTGTVKTTHGQRYVQTGMVRVVGQDGEPKPVGMTNKSVGGAKTANYPGVEKGSGVASVGLLATVWGTVTEVGASFNTAGGYAQYFRLEDGSTVPGAIELQPVLNPGFETFSPGYFPNYWECITPGTADTPLLTLFGCQGLFDPNSGSTCIGRGRGTGICWAYQTVNSAVSGTAYTASVYALSGAASGSAKVRLGVDITGGGDPLASTVVWSPATDTANVWQKLSVDFTASNSSVTIFLESDHTSAHAWTEGQVRTAFDDVKLSSPDIEKKGIKVYNNNTMFMPNPGERWSITGVIAAEKPSGEVTPTPVIIPRDDYDLRMLP